LIPVMRERVSRRACKNQRSRAKRAEHLNVAQLTTSVEI
jgi:hypothetical protein